MRWIASQNSPLLESVTVSFDQILGDPRFKFLWSFRFLQINANLLVWAYFFLSLWPLFSSRVAILIFLKPKQCRVDHAEITFSNLANVNHTCVSDLSSKTSLRNPSSYSAASASLWRWYWMANSLNHYLFSIRVRFSFCWDFSIIPCVLLCFAKVCTHTNVATVTCFVKTQFCQKVSSIGVGNKLTNKDKPIFFTCPCWWSFFHKTENIPRMAHYSQNVQGLLHSLYIKIAGLTYTCMAYTSCSTS